MRVEGKTKIVETSKSNPYNVLVTTKDVLTAGDAAQKEVIEGISRYKTTQTCNVFELLNDHGVPTSFVRREDDASFWAHKCEMFPLEVVCRRYAFGSYLKRNPDMINLNGNYALFDVPIIELFHKQTVVMPPLSGFEPILIGEEDARLRYLRNGAWPKEVHTDPFISFELGTDEWLLYSAKVPLESPLMTIPPVLDNDQFDEVLHVMEKVFMILESAWSNVLVEEEPVELVDLKIEFGRRAIDDKIVVADVIDNDNWRLWPGGDHTKQLDKQCFRDGDDLGKVLENYKFVANVLTNLNYQLQMKNLHS